MTLPEPNITFSALTKIYKSVVLTWFDKPHVQTFYYGDGLKNTLNNLDLYLQGINNNGQYSFDHWIAFIEGKPFGFLMTSPVDENHDFFIKDERGCTLDLLIGDEAYLGKGLANMGPDVWNKMKEK